MDSYPDNSDIIPSFRLGNHNAVKQIYDWFYRPLCFYADNIVHNQQESQDIVVDVFLKLLQKKQDFDTISDIKSFLYTAVRNKSIDYLRKQKRHEQFELESQFTQNQFSEDDPEIINLEVLSILYQEIENLPTQCGAVFKLLFIKKLTTAEAAQTLNISTKTVLNQKGKAILQLRKALYKKGVLTLFCAHFYFL